MNIKMVSSYMGLFLLIHIFCAHAMEVCITEEQPSINNEKDVAVDKKRNKTIKLSLHSPKRKDETIEMGELRNRTKISHSSPASQRATNMEQKHTPRNFLELEDLVKMQSIRSALVFPKDSPQISSIGGGKEKDDEIGSAVSVEEVKKNAQLLAETLKKDIYIGPPLMAQAVLNVHKANKDNPLSVETERYEKMMNREPEKYEDFLEEVLARIIIKHQLGEEHVEPSERILDTHVGFLRKTITKRDKEIFYTRMLAAVKLFWAVGTTIWGAYLQYHSEQSSGGACHNSTV